MVRRSLGLGLVLAGAVGCGGSSSEPSAVGTAGQGGVGAPICESGRQLECACPNGTDGAQRCAEDGSGWGNCQCPDDPPPVGRPTLPNSGGTGGTLEGVAGGTSGTLATGGSSMGGSGQSVGGALPETGGSSAGGAAGSGGTGTTSSGTPGATGGSDAQRQMAVQQGGYVVSCAWMGNAWTGVESDISVGSVIEPADFDALPAGGALCASGTVAPDLSYGGFAMMGINLNQDSAGGAESTWSPQGTAGLLYDVSTPLSQLLRLQIQGAAGYPSAAWCLNISPGSGAANWGEFNTRCWDNSGVSYDGSIPLSSIIVVVPGTANSSIPFDFCIDYLGAF